MNGRSAEALADSPAERAALEGLREAAAGSGTEVAMERHCARTFLIAEEMGRLRGDEFDHELLFCAAMLHDAGIYPSASTGDAYVRDSGRLVAKVLDPLLWSPERIALCAAACEFHHDLRSQWDRGAEVELIRRADLVDVGGGIIRFGVPGAWLKQLFADVPRKGFYRGIGKLLVGVLRERPATLPKIFASRPTSG